MKNIIVAFVLLFSLVSTSFALSLTEEWMKEYNAANYLADEGIIKDVRVWLDISGTDYELIGWGMMLATLDAYRLADTITRKEVMKVVMKLSERTVKDECRWEFSDVSNDWGCKYIEAALDAWYIAANDTFRPDDNITKTEAMKLVLKAKGIEKVKETTDWQSDYMETAHFYGIIDEKYTDFNADASRGWIFVIATATIQKEEEIKEKQEEEEIMSDEAL